MEWFNVSCGLLRIELSGASTLLSVNLKDHAALLLCECVFRCHRLYALPKENILHFLYECNYNCGSSTRGTEANSEPRVEDSTLIPGTCVVPSTSEKHGILAKYSRFNTRPLLCRKKTSIAYTEQIGPCFPVSHERRTGARNSVH